ncbi:L,D-transpeptidase family protein [Myroides injenensis]|uniref:L,D-transpeptidase family protein n=1 Tax=Myroides injenensis TaxID=1183151 RepID=UPI000289F34B|nr:L,D-transpeptidase family protein [Myroides injenensis]
MKRIILFICLSTIFLSCKKIIKDPLQIAYNDSIKASPLTTTNLIAIDSNLVTSQNIELYKLYKDNNFKTVWGSEKNRSQLIHSLNELKNDGINITRYPIDELNSFNKQYDKLNDDEKIKADFLFSDSYFKSTNDIMNGVLNPKRLYNDWDLNKKEFNAPTTLLRAVNNDAVSDSYDSIRPHHKVYNNLREKLIALDNLKKDTLTVINDKITINDTVKNIKSLKKHLSFLSIYPDSLEINDIYNKELKSTIENIQKKYKISINGIPNANTIKAITEEEQLLKEKLIVNLERWRWYPKNFGEHYILINIADFSLVAVSKNDTLNRHKIIVGTTARKTPILTSKLTTIVLNPTWTVPPTILKNDVVPRAKNDSTYFNNRNFTIYDKATGKAVTTENWKPEKFNSYRYVQKGGQGNTLGRIKFMFNNNYSVYLHDTPNKAYFNRTARNMSSGCVRVQDPFDLAQFVFNIQKNDITKEKIEEILKSQKTNNIKTSEEDVFIYQFYWTIQIEDNGKITYFNDVYKYDDNLYSKLK